MKCRLPVASLQETFSPTLPFDGACNWWAWPRATSVVSIDFNRSCHSINRVLLPPGGARAMKLGPTGGVSFQQALIIRPGKPPSVCVCVSESLIDIPLECRTVISSLSESLPVWRWAETVCNLLARRVGRENRWSPPPQRNCDQTDRGDSLF